MSPINVSQPITANVLRHGPKAYRALGKAIAMQDGQGGGPVTKFLQDTGVAWLPKMLISRSRIEGAEVTALEFGESAIAYFLPGPLGKGLRSAYGRMGGREHYNTIKEGLGKSLKDLEKSGASKTLLNKTAPVKAAMILTTIGGIGLLGESLVNYGKNLMTASVFKTDKFSDVANLSHNKPNSDIKNSPQVKKSQERIKQAFFTFGGIMAGSIGLAMVGHKAPQAVQTGLSKLVRSFDFNFKNGSPSISRNMLGAIMAASALPYLDSARDKYEKLETAIRLPVVFAYILFGQELLQKGMQSVMPKQLESIKGLDGKIKDLDTIAKDALNTILDDKKISRLDFDKLASSNPAKHAEILQKTAEAMKQPLKAKALHIGLPLAFGISVTGIGLGLLNRYLSQYRYQKSLQQQAPMQQAKDGPTPPTSQLPPAFSRSTSSPFSATPTSQAVPNPSSPFQQRGFVISNAQTPSYFSLNQDAGIQQPFQQKTIIS